MISLTEFYLSDKSKQAQMIVDSNSEIIRLNNKLSKIKELINRTPRQTPKEIAYVMLKGEIAKVIGDDKK